MQSLTNELFNVHQIRSKPAKGRLENGLQV